MTMKVCLLLLTQYTGPPQMLSVNATTSTSLLVSWEAPNLVADTDGDLEYFYVSCNKPFNDGDPFSATVSFNGGAQFSATISDLQPYTTYTCCVFADTTVGLSTSSCLISTTLQDSKTIVVQFLNLPITDQGLCYIYKDYMSPTA